MIISTISVTVKAKDEEDFVTYITDDREPLSKLMEKDSVIYIG